MSTSALSTAPIGPRAGDDEIIITRILDAPRRLVFEAWTDPRHVARWWGPNGFSSAGCEIDLRVGGSFRLQLIGPDGKAYPCRGTYREIVPPERIVFLGVAEDSHPCGSGLPPRAVVTVTFAELGDRTALTIHTKLASTADRDAAIEMGFNAGWSESFERLERFLASAE